MNSFLFKVLILFFLFELCFSVKELGKRDIPNLKRKRTRLRNKEKKNIISAPFVHKPDLDKIKKKKKKNVSTVFSKLDLDKNKPKKKNNNINNRPSGLNNLIISRGSKPNKKRIKNPFPDVANLGGVVNDVKKNADNTKNKVIESGHVFKDDLSSVVNDGASKVENAIDLVGDEVENVVSIVGQGGQAQTRNPIIIGGIGVVGMMLVIMYVLVLSYGFYRWWTAPLPDSLYTYIPTSFPTSLSSSLPSGPTSVPTSSIAPSASMYPSLAPSPMVASEVSGENLVF